ncbi:MAG: hypothetical protein IJO32_00420 [Bacilli bacterium]|nr:hypothetical protein [Bacilli bacterium]
MDLYNELMQKQKELDICIKSLRKTGNDYAEAYTNYRIKLSQELVKLRDEGMPVTIAYDVARGKQEIAKAKFNEISKEAIYKANLESINAIKLQIKILDNQLEKEWGNAK